MTNDVRLVLDTNIFVSSLLFHRSISRRVFERAATSETILVSLPVWLELAQVLKRPKFRKYFTQEEAALFLSYLGTKAEWVAIHDAIEVCRDPKDDRLLELAVSGRADCLITADKDLLVLDPFRNVRILTAEAFQQIPASL
jgi:putative PIN family toxin of toxin-antitoxin system